MALVVPDTVVLLFHVREGSGLHSEFGLLGLGPEFSLCFCLDLLGVAAMLL